MLVLSRYRDESIIIGDDVVITVVDVRGDRVRLGIQAPAHVSVHRREIYEAIAKEKELGLEGKAAQNKNRDSFGKGIPTDAGGEASLGLDSFGGVPH